MRTIILELGFTLIAALLAISFLAGFHELIGDGGNLKEIILDYIGNIC